MNALHFAAQKGHAGACKVLLDKGDLPLELSTSPFSPVLRCLPDHEPPLLQAFL